MEDNQYRCESCNGIMEFDAATQTLRCPNCDSTLDIIKEGIIEEHSLSIDAKRSIKPEQKETKTMVCKGCGAHMEIAGNETAAKCPYCDSTYVLAEDQESTLIPDGVIPFKIEKKELAGEFEKWIKKRWLAPSALKNLYQRGSFQGIYVPYWTFDADTVCSYTAMGGRNREEHYTDSEGKRQTRIHTDWYFTRGVISKAFDDIQVPASARFKKGLFSGLEPFDFKALQVYSPDYFAGYMSENFSIGLEDGHKEAVNDMENQLRQAAGNDVMRKYDTYKDVRISVKYSNESYKYLMLPIYSTAYTYKDKNYTVLVNGQNGKFKGEYPKSPAKIIIIILVILVLLIIGYFVSGGSGESDTSYNQIEHMEYTAGIYSNDNEVATNYSGVTVVYNGNDDFNIEFL